jgi:hypothetical protein
LKAKRQQSGASAVGEEAKVANADEAFGQQVQQEAAQELITIGASVSVHCYERSRANER